MASIQQVERMLAQGDNDGLCRALRDRNSLVRRRAVQALGELKQAGSTTHLRQVLNKEKDQYVVRWAVDALEAIGDAAAVDALTEVAFGSNRQIASLASQALSRMELPAAQTVTQLREMLTRSELAGLAALGEEVRGALLIILHSPQYKAWPSAKRREVLMAAVRVGVEPPAHFRRELAAMGIFVPGIHTVGDLLAGLNHRSAAVRIAAAGYLGRSGRQWARLPLYSRFQREVQSGGDRGVAVAAGRALAQLGDRSAINYYRAELHRAELVSVAEAARALAEIRLPESTETLFQFAAGPPPAQASRNVPQALAALESCGAEGIDHLRENISRTDRRGRLILIPLITHSGHQDTIPLLVQFAHDLEVDVQRSAVEALAELGTTDAAWALIGLRYDVPKVWIVRALAGFTDPVIVDKLRAIAPETTTVHGTLTENYRNPLPGVVIQVVREDASARQAGGNWMAISPRAETDTAGKFALAVIGAGEEAESVRLKVITPPRGDNQAAETFTAAFTVQHGRANTIEANIDRYLGRMAVLDEKQMRQIEEMPPIGGKKRKRKLQG